jgi:TonB-dependent starch-binding outer membrane protein SusC
MRVTILKIPMAAMLTAVLACLAFSVYPQTFANAKSANRSDQVNATETLKLRDAVLSLKSRYKVNILFDEKLLEGISVADSLLNFEQGLENNLASVLMPHNLNYQRIKKNAYVITAGAAVLAMPTRELNAATVVQHSATTNVANTESVPFLYGALADGITVTGTVLDENGLGLPGANIIEKGTTNGTTSDTNGKYSLTVAGESSVLIFSFIGYLAKEVLVGTNNSVTIALEPDITSLNEIVVIGYGSREKKDLTGAISDIKSEDIGKSISVNPETAMQGRMAGVFVASPGGAPTARPQVRIRGVSTFNIADPLYVVDGVPLFEYGGGTEEGSVGFIRGSVNVLTLINPGDIESMTVLKDAAASAIYGSRASNGVILITTKKGKKGQAKVEFNTTVGVQNIAQKYDMLNTQQFTALYQEMFAAQNEYDRLYAPNANPTTPHPWDQPSSAYLNVFNPNSAHPYYQYLGNSPTYDWQSELINKNAAMQDYGVRVSGGSDNVTYYIGTGYSKTESPLINNNLERLSLTANVQATISRFIEAGLSYQVSNVQAFDNTFHTGSLYGAANISPWQPIYDPNDPTGFARTTDVALEDNPAFDLTLANPGPRFRFVAGSVDLRPWGLESNQNYFAQMKLRDNNYTLFKNFGTAYLQVTPLKGLKIKGQLSIDLVNNKRVEWIDAQEYRFSETPQNPYDGQDGNAFGELTDRRTTNTNFLKDITISYNKAFGNHNFDLLLNASDQIIQFQTAAVSSPVYTEVERFRSIGGDPRWVLGSSSGVDEKVLQGYVGRLSYSYQDKYYVDVAVRRDGSSNFAPGYRWGVFPGISAAWRISSENFFQGLTKVVDNLKMRVGYGTVGNTFSTNTGGNNFPYLSTVNFNPTYALGSGGNNPFGVTYTGAFLPKFANETLSWEKAKTFNIGFDASWFGGKLTSTIEYYNKNTEDIIQRVNLPSSTGIKDQVEYNIGAVNNQGIELALGYNTSLGPVKLNLSGNLTTVKNRITKVDPISENYFGGFKVGLPIGSIVGYKVGGIFQTQAEIDAYRAVTEDFSGAVQRPGDMWFQDINSEPEAGDKFFTKGPDGLVNPNDRTVLGKTIPGFYYGFSVSANYKAFDLSVFLQGIGDVQKVNGVRIGGELLSGRGLNMWTTTLNRWTTENPSSTMPRAIYGDPNQNSRFSDRWVEDAGFMRVKNVQLGYTLPVNIIQKLKAVSSVRVFFSGTNLFTFTKWQGIDPENDLTPPTRVLSSGLTVTF